MHCTNCGATLDEDSKFCTECGKAVQGTPAKETTTTARPSTSNKVLSAIIDHLEFLGYDVKEFQPEKNGDQEVMLAKHEKLNNVVIFSSLPGFILFQVNLNCQRAPSPEANAFINKINHSLDICRVYYRDEDGNMVIKFEAMYVGGYNKELFAKFHSLFEKDQQRFTLQEGFAETFLEKNSASDSK